VDEQTHTHTGQYCVHTVKHKHSCTHYIITYTYTIYTHNSTCVPTHTSTLTDLVSERRMKGRGTGVEGCSDAKAQQDFPIKRTRKINSGLLARLHLKWHHIPCIVHYLCPGPIALWSNAVHYIGNRVPFRMQIVFHSEHRIMCSAKRQNPPQYKSQGRLWHTRKPRAAHELYTIKYLKYQMNRYYTLARHIRSVC
jgi:hypothetical protein